jgi:hypothetical protein
MSRQALVVSGNSKVGVGIGMDDEIPIRSYTDLDVWKVSVALAGICYRLTKVFPDEERYGMTSQIRRASTSIAANIAEG